MDIKPQDRPIAFRDLSAALQAEARSLVRDTTDMIDDGMDVNPRSCQFYRTADGKRLRGDFIDPHALSRGLMVY
jgi:hypothetical protein